MLRPQKKLSKREIKEDSFVTTVVRFQRIYQKYSKTINYAALGILAVAVLSIFMIRSKASAEKSAESSMGLAEQLVLVQDFDPAIQALNQIVTNYPGTNAAGKALFYLGNIYFQRQDIPNAEKYYHMVIDDYSKMDLIGASGFAGIAACHESKKEYVQAAEYFEKAARASKNDFYTPFYLKDAGRCYSLAGLKEKSQIAYQEIVEKFPESSLKQEAESLLKSL